MAKLTKRQFRFLLLIYMALIAAGIFRALSQRTPLTSRDVVVAKSNLGLQGLSDQQFACFMVWVIGAVLGAWLVGLVSLFFLWRPGVYIFLAAACGILAVGYLRRLRLTSDWALYGGVEVGLKLMIVAFALFGPAKHLFRRQFEVKKLI